jgi:hypothetical protein
LDQCQWAAAVPANDIEDYKHAGSHLGGDAQPGDDSYTSTGHCCLFNSLIAA